VLTRIVGYVFLAVVITNTTGCSLLISGAGVSTAAPRTRELVRREFGQPQRISTIRLQHSTGETREFEVEHYLVHRKFAPPIRTWGLSSDPADRGARYDADHTLLRDP
jgi:hypothetical protein